MWGRIDHAMDGQDIGASSSFFSSFLPLAATFSATFSALSSFCFSLSNALSFSFWTLAASLSFSFSCCLMCSLSSLISLTLCLWASLSFSTATFLRLATNSYSSGVAGTYSRVTLMIRSGSSFSRRILSRGCQWDHLDQQFRQIVNRWQVMQRKNGAPIGLCSQPVQIVSYLNGLVSMQAYFIGAFSAGSLASVFFFSRDLCCLSSSFSFLASFFASFFLSSSSLASFASFLAFKMASFSFCLCSFNSLASFCFSSLFFLSSSCAFSFSSCFCFCLSSFLASAAAFCSGVSWGLVSAGVVAGAYTGLLGLSVLMASVFVVSSSAGSFVSETLQTVIQTWSRPAFRRVRRPSKSYSVSRAITSSYLSLQLSTKNSDSIPRRWLTQFTIDCLSSLHPGGYCRVPRLVTIVIIN